MKNIGFMQGRLSPIINNKIQAFPKDYWLDEFPLAKKLNLSCIEWTLDYPDLEKNPLLLDEFKSDIIHISKKNEIKIPSITLDCCMQRPFWKKQNLSLYVDLIFDLKKIISSASSIGARIIVIPLVDNGSIENKFEFDLLKDTISSLYDFLESNKVKIAFESDFSPVNLSDFIKRYDKNFIGINYDTGNSACLGFDPEEEFRNYGERIINVHIKDRKINGGTVRLGEGDTKFKEVFNYFKFSDYEGNYILQTARSKNKNHVEELDMNISFVKSYIE